ncbi:hypothetical protein C0V75_07430 [Tabrizicola sp. TH137]|uniref:hypothetical protein n=1 Tax=Tabrizicola sp. TH137 TaxID=2067452 RepID=UPI000C79782E|nr:hypothetical protein [Tabrizicola sp. TH137]PLL13230.1 hypothetical protein C0V75_07430 [Tabrizicola sp. TH137]
MPIDFRTGNAYNFNPKNMQVPTKVVERLNEKGELIRERVVDREAFLGLNKIELRYNVRRGQPEYKAMESLYKLRSVFGYRLGGAIRRAYVKLAEVTRHGHNLVSLCKAISKTQSQKAEAKKNDEDIGQTKLDKHVRQYSTRDIMLALSKNHQGDPNSVKYLKYLTWNQHGQTEHKIAATQDYSFRKLVIDGVKNLANTKTDTNALENLGWQEEVRFYLLNVEGEQKFNEQKPVLLQETKEKVVNLETRLWQEKLDSAIFYKKNTDKNHGTYNETIKEARERLNLLENGTIDQLAEVYPEIKEARDAVYVPKEPSIRKEVFEEGAFLQKVENKVGGLSRFLSENTPFKIIERNYEHVKVAIGKARFSFGHKEEADRTRIAQIDLDKPIVNSKTQEMNMSDVALKDLLKGVNFNKGSGKDLAFPDLAPDPIVPDELAPENTNKKNVE